MITRCITLMIVLLPALLLAQPRTAFINGQPWPDNNGVPINAHGGGILYQTDRYYWYGEHKVAGRRGNSAQVGVSCYSSTGLYNWKDEGIVLKVSDDPASEIVRGCVIERPKVIYNAANKQYVMWFHLELRGKGYVAARTGLAVSSSPTGPFEYKKSFRPNAGQWPVGLTKEQAEADKGCQTLCRDFQPGQMARDMTLFVDDDGKAYHIHASEENQTLHISQLTGDYLDFSSVYARVLPGDSNEAPAIFKQGGKYYMISSGCTGWAPNAARSSVADSILGPWKPLGNPCSGVNPHNNLGPEKTFGAQSTFILPVTGQKDCFIAIFDVWTPQNPIDGRYIFLPITHQDGKLQVQWQDQWILPGATPPAAKP